MLSMFKRVCPSQETSKNVVYESKHTPVLEPKPVDTPTEDTDEEAPSSREPVPIKIHAFKR